MDPEQSDYLSADSIWAANDIVEQDIDVPEWGGKVRIRGLTLAEMASLANKASRRNPAGGQDIIDRETSVALTLIYGMVNPKLTEQDAQRLKAKSAAAVTRIVQAINALGPTEDAVSDATKSDAFSPNGTHAVLPGAGVENHEG